MLATVEDWGEEILPEGVGVNGKNGPGGGEGEGKINNFKCPTPSSPLHKSFTGQTSKMVPSKTLFTITRSALK